MKTHKIEITETFTLNIEVEAETEKEALKQAEQRYSGEEMDLREHEETEVKTTFEIIPEKQMKPILEVLRIKQITTVSTEEMPFQISSPEDLANIARQMIGDEDREVFLIICLTIKNQVSAVHRSSMGSLNSSIVTPREVFKTAILNNAYSIAVAHNHPSFNSPAPSDADIEVTKRLVECGELLGIELLDHVIVSGQKFLSLREINCI